MPDTASTAVPVPPADAAPEAPAAASDPADALPRALEAVRRTRATDGDTPEIAADDEGATSLAEELAVGAQTP